MDDLIIISNLNDFIFCPASIYFHKLYGSEDTIMYQSKAQLDGTKALKKVDKWTYSTRKKYTNGDRMYIQKYYKFFMKDRAGEVPGYLRLTTVKELLII